jgi:thymidylate synthase (FAD)
MKNILDHGYLKFIEKWGSDEAIIEAARMSTGKGFLGWGSDGKCDRCGERDVTMKNGRCRGEPGSSHDWNQYVGGDEKLLRYLYENRHCYDSETEVLVRHRGFVRWPDVSTHDELGCFDWETDSLVYEIPKELIRQAYRGDMYRVDHGGVDLLVTPEHRMMVKTIVRVGPNKQGWSDTWRLERADELGDRSMVRYRKHAARRDAPAPDLTMFPPHDDPRELLRLIGFFLGDGFAGRDSSTERNTINFHLRKQRKIDWLAEVCAGLGWEMEEKSSVIVRAPGITKTFRDMFYDDNDEKHLPAFLLDLSADYAEAVLDGLRNSDGSEKRCTWTYSTTSSKLAQAVQLLALHAGTVVHIGEPQPSMKPEHKPLHRLMVLSRMREPVINQGKKNTSRVPYDGTIYCARTRTGVLVVRRNGKIVLSGNSTPFEMAGMTIEVQAPIFVFREWHRHRVPFGYNEMSARYTPLPDLNYVPTVGRLLVNSKTNKQAGTIKGAEELTETVAASLMDEEREFNAAAERFYQKKLASGVPKELARTHLGVSRYSRMRATSNLRGWLAFLTLRMAPAAQYEIRVYAEAVGALIAESFPRTWELFAEGKR